MVEKLKTNGFIKDEDLLREDSHVDDLLDFSEQINSFTNRLNEISKPAIIALVGKYGSGKSTMLHQLVKSKDENKDLWIEFDAWKYPDRKDLWEGFILDFARQTDELAKIKNRIDGKVQSEHFIKAGLAQIPGFNLDKLFEILESPPAKRVFELQEIFEKLIQKQKKNIYIIVEDIDRSGDSGIYFLETLQQFIRNLRLDNKKFIVIVPIGSKNHKDQDKFESYLKCVDYFEDFKLENIKLSNFIDKIFDERILHGKTAVLEEKQITKFLEQLFIEFRDTMSPRLLKIILRKANMVYKNQITDGHKPDFRITIMIEAANYFYPNETFIPPSTYFNKFCKNKSIDRDTIFAALIYSIYTHKTEVRITKRNESNIDDIVNFNVKINYNLDERCGEIEPFKQDKMLNIYSFYLNY